MFSFCSVASRAVMRAGGLLLFLFILILIFFLTAKFEEYKE